MLSRRHFLHFAGLGGLSLAGLPLLPGCSTAVPAPSAPGPDPLPDDPSKPWWLRKNFAPVGESEARDLAIVGALPPTLSGLYLRNGPNPKGVESRHWFVGDGMVHGVLLDKGKAPWYRARFVQTPVLGGAKRGEGPPGLAEHQASTGILGYQGRVFCGQEVGLPYEIKKNDLSTVGPYDFSGKLKTAMTAHPKIDPVTGELMFFAYGLSDPIITYHRCDAKGALVQTETIPVPKALMMHDFQVTETRVIFMDLPMLFDLDRAIAGDPLPYVWRPESGARLGVMPRAGTAADVKWIEVDPCFVFHTWNAWDDPADPNVVHLEGVRFPSLWDKGSTDFNTTGSPHRFSIDLARAKVSLTKLDDRFVEFPRINPARQGRRYRYGYGVTTTLEPSEPGATPALNQIVKYDWVAGKTVVHALPADQEAGEAMFVQDPQGTAEDDGWLLAYVFSRATSRSHLLVLDATDVAGGPVAKVELPGRVPHGFHGDFLPTGA
ncbi:carotenoid oxygenase family protein [Sorangium sp. So ce406]|uniref:carotenoid oxygenase family protein n=1 Tax=Sorangium sp. So ce406 TaxID=3133311 RepID=UPI003F5B54AA